MPDHDSTRDTCLEHSGIKSRLDGGLALIAAMCAMLGYQTFIQVPNLRSDMLVAQQRLEGRVTVLENDVNELKAQRNADHPKTTPLR